MAARSTELAAPPAAPGCGDDLRWPLRSPGGADESRMRVAMDSLARAHRPRTAWHRQCFLHRLPVYAATYYWPALLAGRLELAARLAKQVAGGAPHHHVLMGVRGAVPMGPAAMVGLPCTWLFRRGL